MDEGSMEVSMSGPNIVLIVIDAWRQDACGLFTDDYHHTPALDGDREQWLRFDKCFASAPWTLPSCTSILTGIEAGRHGRFDHSHAGPVPTLATWLADSYESAGFVNNGNLVPSSGLTDSFGTWEYFHPHAAPFEAAQSFVRNRDRQKPYFLFFHSNIPHDYWHARSQQYY
jgi:membrane-anchored protein YejM (alkaline phosphatase superfamily)